MDIVFNGKYKSLRNFTWNDLPPLTILTGLNGSGKSQILEVIDTAYSNSAHNQTFNGVFKHSDYTIELRKVLFEKRGLLNWTSRGGHFQFENYNFSYNDLEEIINLIMQCLVPPSVIKHKREDEDNTSTEYHQSGINRVKHLIESKKQKIISTLVERTGKQPAKILAEDVLNHLPEDVIFEDYDVISEDYLDMTFYCYLYRKVSLENQPNDKHALGKAPWAVLNEVIGTAGLPYSFTSPDEEPIRAIFRNPLNRNSTYKFKIKLVNADGVEIGIQNISSGEKVILSLAMLLYYFQHRDVRKKLLLLDEIDAHLHPSLTKQFFQVVNQNVIRDYHATVIMATHSPSTVALAHDDSLFIVEKGQTHTIIKRSTKDTALNLLTAGVPSLSVNYENRRQIFVESKYDAEYYDYLYQAIRTKLPEGVSLNFISSGVSGSGNCDQVITIVNQLNEFGNKSIFGIIDWDLKNKSSRNIQVLGEGKRYSIENYIFDPVLMGYFLWREKILNAVDFGFPNETSILDFKSLRVADIQRISDGVLNKIKSRFKVSQDQSLSIAKYANGMEILVPKWYTTNYGHQLPDIYMTEFPNLKKYHQENGFRSAVIVNTITDISTFIPDDLVQLMKYFHELEVH